MTQIFKEREYLRKLAVQYLEIADLPIMKEREKLRYPSDGYSFSSFFCQWQCFTFWFERIKILPSKISKEYMP